MRNRIIFFPFSNSITDHQNHQHIPPSSSFHTQLTHFTHSTQFIVLCSYTFTLLYSYTLILLYFLHILHNSHNLLNLQFLPILLSLLLLPILPFLWTNHDHPPIIHPYFQKMVCRCGKMKFLLSRYIGYSPCRPPRQRFQFFCFLDMFFL